MSYPTLSRQIAGVTLVVMLIAACGASAPKAEIEAEIETSQGTVVVREVQLVDRFPPGCNDESPACDRAREGHRHLIVWMG